MIRIAGSIVALACAFAVGVWISASGLFFARDEGAGAREAMQDAGSGNSQEQAIPGNAIVVTTADVAFTPPR